MKVVHFSDIHLRCGYDLLPALRFLGKRIVGLTNLKLFGREKLFLSADFVFTQLLEEIAAEAPDHVVATGDFTTMAFEREFEMVREKFQIMGWDGGHLSVVPGNHDYYTLGSETGERFESYFAPYIASDLPQHRVPGRPYPFVKLVGERLAIIGVNSAKANPLPWDSSGKIGTAQLRKLEEILGHPEVRGRFSILMTHYAPFRHTGAPDTRRHGILDCQAFLDLLRRHRPDLVVHGHIHHNYVIPQAIFPVPIACAGSATHAGREHYNVYTIDDDGNLEIEARKFDARTERFETVRTERRDRAGRVARAS